MQPEQEPTVDATINAAVDAGAAHYNRECDGAILPVEARAVISGFLLHFPAGMELRRFDHAEGRVRRLSCDDLRFLGELVADWGGDDDDDE